MENELLESRVTIKRQGDQLEDYNVKLMEQNRKIEDMKCTDVGAKVSWPFCEVLKCSGTFNLGFFQKDEFVYMCIVYA